MPTAIERNLIASHAGLKPGNRPVVVTIKPSQISAGVGNTGSASWRADGYYTFHSMHGSEQGTADSAGHKEFELEVSSAGDAWQNKPVSARALFADGLGRRFSDLLEGRVLLVAKGDVIDVTFHNIDAGNAIDPRLHFVGHRGWPIDWHRRGVLPIGAGRPFVYVARGSADAALTTGNSVEVSYEFSNCYAFSRMAWADRVTAAGYRLDIDAWLLMQQGAEQTLADSAGRAARAASLRGLCGDEGLDLVDLLGGWPMQVENGETHIAEFHNNSGSTVYPRILWLGHEGLALGHIDIEEQLAVARGATSIQALIQQAHHPAESPAPNPIPTT